MNDREPISIDDLIVLLRNCGKDAEVRYDFPPYQFPTEVDSWRGSYDQPALGHAGKDSHNDASVNMRGRDSNDGPKVSALIAELEKATDGRTYQGWKGGDYSYSGRQFLWVDNPGEFNKTAIVGVYDDGYQVILRTAWQP